jgi:hypothetical protein
MNSIFEAESVWCVALPGLGRVFLQEHNQQPGRVVICRVCHGPIQPEEGCRIKAERFSQGAVTSGYICPVCIKHSFENTSKWHWSDMDSSLFKANGYTSTPISGQRLADLWILNGQAGLMAAIREALEEKVSIRKG